MKKMLLKSIILLSFSIGIGYSCKQEIKSYFDGKAVEIENAQAWYKENRPQNVFLKSANFKEGKLYAKPDWKHAHIGNHDDIKTVEIPISTQGRFGFITKECRQAFEHTGDRRYMKSLTQLVIVTEKESKKSYGFLMTIVPDKSFLETTGFKSYYSKYKKWQKNFSGYIMYHSLDGDFVNGWKLSEGKVIKSVKQAEGTTGSGQLDIHLKSLVCYDVYITKWYQDCTDWYTEVEGVNTYVGTTCGEPYSVEEYLYTECYEDGNRNGEFPKLFKLNN